VPANPPVAPKRPQATTIHGVTLSDDYFYLREKGTPAVDEYLQAEDSYARAVMAPTQPLQDALYREMLGHIQQTDESAPFPQDGAFYYTRTIEGQQYPMYCRKRGSLDAPEEVLLDLNALATGHAYFAIGAFAVSDDGHLLAYTTDTTGYRQYRLHIKDLRGGQLLPDTAERVTDVVWATGAATIFYVTEDETTKRSNKLFRHGLGADAHDLIYDERDELFDLSLVRSRDKAVIFLESCSKTSTEVRYLDARRPAGALNVIALRQPDHEYDVEHRGDLFYIRTNKGAKNFRVVTAPVTSPAEAYWTELVPHRPEAKIARVDPFARHLVLSVWEDGLQQIEIRDLDTGKTHRIQFPEPVYSASLGPNAEFETTTVRYLYQSLVTPVSVFDYDMSVRQDTLRKQTAVPGGFDRTQYSSARVLATAPDGTRVPISLVSRRDVPRDGSAPLLLYAYGSYGYSIAPLFSSSRLSLLDRGVTYAIAHVRGGGELGETWREAGRMMRKMNTFTDFIACAEHLIAERHTSADRLVIQGGSAGGLLVGVAINRRPDLVKAAIAQVPFVDVLNTMLDASLPLTTSEYIEWGDPRERPAFEYMQHYSPYDNVRRQAYPAMLIKVSVHDSQVPYWEGAKLTAKLRALKTDTNPLLLKVNFGAGHGGASGRYDALRDTAFDYAFVLWQTQAWLPNGAPGL
jgi:oligopeptidase B